MNVGNWRKFDLVRGGASIAVLFSHVIATFVQRLIGSEHSWVFVSVAVARHAVLLFFLLSGFLIAKSLLANIARNGKLNMQEYLLARCVRIYPPFLGSILIVMVVWLIIHGLQLPGAVRYGIEGDLFAVRSSFELSFKDVGLALLMQEGMLHANGPLWSLYIECHLYLVAMFLTGALGSKGRLRLVWLLLAAALCLVKIYRAPQALLFGAVWFLGAACAIWGKAVASGTLRKVMAGVVWVTIFVILGIASGKPAWLNPHGLNGLASNLVQFFACVVYAYFLFFVPDIRVMWPRWILKASDYSYSLYVIHFPLLLLVLSLTQVWAGGSFRRSVIVACFAVGFSIFIAYWFAKLFENQAIFRPWVQKFLNFIYWR